MAKPDDPNGPGMGDDSTLPPVGGAGEPVVSMVDASTLLPPKPPAEPITPRQRPAGAGARAVDAGRTPADPVTPRQRPGGAGVGAVVASPARAAAVIVDRVPAAWRDPAARDPRPASERYRIAGEVGRGGLGRVLEAEDTWLGRPVAVKELQSGRGGDEPRFRREALITARLQHPGIVPVHDAGHWSSGDPFYTMKLVSGRSLAEAIRETQSYPERLRLLPAVRAVANAIAYAHGHQVIHRDLKPANVMLGEYGETVVIDWGLAKQLGEAEDSIEARPDFDAASSGDGLTVAGSVLGTPAYMSPEQARGEPLDERTDVYALGVILYAVLSGAPPQRGATPQETLVRVASAASPRVREREPAVPEDLAAIVDKAMAGAPADRYPSASEMAEDLARFEAGRLVRAHSYSLAALLFRWVVRHRAAVAVASIAALLMISLGVVALRRIVREKSYAQRQETIANRQRAAAQDRANQVTLLQARSALASDPTAALAWLKQLEIDEGNLADVRTVAQRATSQGAAFDLVQGGVMINDLAISPDGQQVALPVADGAVLLRDLATGASRRLPGDAGLVMWLAYAPDGRYLASAAEDGSVLLWDLQTDQPARIGQHRAVASALTFSPDGRWLAAAAESPDLMLCELATRAVRTLPVSESSVWDLAFSSDSRTLATAGADGTVRVVDVASGEVRTLGHHDAEVYTVAFGPDDDRLASVGVDGTVRLWSVTSGTAKVWRGHQGATVDVAFSPDGRWLATTSQDNAVRLWDTDDGHSWLLSGHEAASWALGFAPDGDSLVTSGHDGTVRQWDLGTGDCRVLRGHTRPVVALAISPDGVVVSGDMGGEVRMWRSQPRESQLLARGAPLWALADGPDRGRVAFAAGDGSIGIVDLATAQQRLAPRSPKASAPLGPRVARILAERGAEVLGLGFLPGDDQLISISADRTAQLWDLTTGGALVLAEYPNRPQRLAVSPDGAGFAIKFDVDMVVARSVDGAWSRSFGDRERGASAVAWAPDSRRYAVGDVTGDIQVVDVASDASILLDGHGVAVTRLAFSPDGRSIAACTDDGQLSLWEVASRSRRVIAGACYRRTTPVFAADGSLLAVAGIDTIRVVELETRDRATRTLIGHDSTVGQLRFSADTAFLVATGVDGTIWVWDLARNSHRVFSDHRQRVVGIAITGDPIELISAGRDGEVRLWHQPFVDDLPATPDDLRDWLASVTRATISSRGRIEGGAAASRQR